QTFVPSLQFLQISISLRDFNMLCLKLLYCFPVHISRKGIKLVSPSLWLASLSKQQGTTDPLKVTTQLFHMRQHWFTNLFLMTYVPSDCNLYREYFGLSGISGLPCMSS